jgi:hypothetical protein
LIKKLEYYEDEPTNKELNQIRTAAHKIKKIIDATKAVEKIGESLLEKIKMQTKN